jgi:hypothetical protein
VNENSRRPVPGQPSMAFNSVVGIPVPAPEFLGTDYLIDPGRFASEGNWAFCRFTSRQVPGARIGFQRGGFNGGNVERAPSRSYLQLHLELLTEEGAVLWIPSGEYDASKVISDPERMDMRLDHDGKQIFRLSGWPSMVCRFCSADGYAEADLQFDLAAVTVLPDCHLPHCLFAMWESMGEVTGSVRYGTRTVPVEGKVFFDHTRIIPQRHTVLSRHMYVYTTLYFDDGSGVFGYHSLDARGRPIDEYCFGVYLHADGGGRLLTGTLLTDLVLDTDGIAKSWRLSWEDDRLSLVAQVTVQDTPILQCWGPLNPPRNRKEYSIVPLVLDSAGHVTEAGRMRSLRGYGLAEYFNANLWPADAAALVSEPLSDRAGR